MLGFHDRLGLPRLWQPGLYHGERGIASMGVKGLSLDEHPGDLRMHCLDTMLDLTHRRLNACSRQRVLEVEAQSYEHVTRAEVHRERFIKADNARLRGGDLADARPHLRAHALACEQALTFVGQERSS